jgi:S-disulfanyl-L-cysteine oxidoreductase SoxD
MATSRTFSAGLLIAIAMNSGAAEPPAPLGIGRPATVHDIARADITALPDGTGLPPGRGTARQGVPIYAAKCAACHGDKGQGVGDFPALVGGIGTLAGKEPLLTVGSYWPTATTIFDYIRRAMPYQSAGELSDDEVYALTAWLLSANGIIKPTDTLDRARLPRVRMPNRDGFIAGHPETTP